MRKFLLCAIILMTAAALACSHGCATKRHEASPIDCRDPIETWMNVCHFPIVMDGVNPMTFQQAYDSCHDNWGSVWWQFVRCYNSTYLPQNKSCAAFLACVPEHGFVTPPADDDTAADDDDNDDTSPPVDDDASPPADDDDTTPADDDQTPPDDDDDNDDDNDDNDDTSPPADDDTRPPDDDDLTPPTDDDATPPTDDDATPPSDDEASPAAAPAEEAPRW